MSYTIEQGLKDWWVWEAGVYEQSSVLAGQVRRARVKRYDTQAEAQADYPDAEVIEGSPSAAANRDAMESFDRQPAPAWFDPADAGERWDEDY